MRISTLNSYSSSIETLLDRQTKLSDSQGQMTTGKRVNSASDDPAAAARAERALASERHTIATQRAVDASDNAMTLTEGALGDAVTLLQQSREALVAAGNGTYSDSERLSTANQLTDLRNQLFAIANRTDGSGTYLFGGQGSTQPPFADQPGGVVFNGTPGQVQVASGEALPLTMNGDATWMHSRTGNGVFETSVVTSTGTAWIDTGQVTDPSAITGSTYSLQFAVNPAGATTYSILKDGVATPATNVAFKAGQAIQIDGMSVTLTGAPANGDAFEMKPSTSSLSVFDALDKAIADLKIPGRAGNDIAQTNSDNLNNVTSVLNQVIGARSDIGATMTRIDSVTERLGALKLSSQSERSSAEDLDMTQAISDFANQQTGYSAALQAYSMVQRLSLFNYINS